jgi:mannose/cellobiose epimerase-like protein (N-acyl-D-glucosamine 2-epimerase family)
MLPTLRNIVLTNISHVLARFQRDPSYGFIDTKFSLLTGLDFPDSDPVRAKSTLYGWIQARGLESLATHALWLQSDPATPPATRDLLAPQLLAATRTLTQNLESLRKNAGGHLTFMMSPLGQPIGIAADNTAQPLTLDLQGHNTLSDLFHVKALAAASVALNDPALASLAHDRAQSIYADILARQLYFDQQPFDPKNPVRQIPGRHILGPLMIGIYACSWLARANPSHTSTWNNRANTLIDKALAEHCHTAPKTPHLQPGDFWEFVDDNAKPYRQPTPDNALLSDPGHGIEVAGLGLRHLIQAHGITHASQGTWDNNTEKRAQLLSLAFQQNFNNGWAPTNNGLYKLINLDTRLPYNTQLPWWSLPEAMRAAAAAALIAPTPADKQRFLTLFQKAFTAFTKNFVRPDLHFMAYQALDDQAKPLDIVPATPDADPGYHTGLSLLDAIQYLSHKDPHTGLSIENCCNRA